MPSIGTGSAVALLLALTFGGPVPEAVDANGEIPEITVTATDYAFLPLPAMQSGRAVIGFVNQGKVAHEVAIARLKPTTSVDLYLKAAAGAERRALIEGFVGILIAEPGTAATGKLLVDLSKGATYMVWCNFRDKPDAPPHMVLGMYTTFTPK